MASAAMDTVPPPSTSTVAASSPPAPRPQPPTRPVPFEAIRVGTPEIRWHCGPTGLNEAVLSLDYLQQDDPASPWRVLATGGADKEIKLWRIQRQWRVPTAGAEGTDGLEFVFSLSGHDRSINCVRFSPNGQYLASASDDSTVLLWMKPKTAGDDWRWDTISSFSDVTRVVLACGHKGDITDLAWSPDSAFLCSTSVDNCSVIWNIEKGEVVERRKDHTQYVQGAAWDPLGEFLATEGNDRTCRVYTLTGFDAIARQSTSKKQNRKCTNLITIKTRDLPPPEGQAVASLEGKSTESTEETATPKVTAKHRLFHDDTCPVFARRLSWTPDGNYLLVPTGMFRSSESAPSINTVYAFARGNMAVPSLHLPGQEKPSLGIRCNPHLYALRGSDGSSAPSNFFQTQYRSIFAVITLNAVIIYDSQQRHPVCTIKNLHYADLTDATWTSDGQTLSVSSMDGYVSFIHFDSELFGSVLPDDAQQQMIDQKTRSMFTPLKTTKKRAKAAAAAASAAAPPTTSDETAPAAKTPLVVKKKPSTPLTSPIMQAFQKRDCESQAPQPVVNMLQVRKKRKITPVLVTAAQGDASVRATAQSTTVAPGESIDLTQADGPAGPPAPVAPSATANSVSPNTGGSPEDPINLSGEEEA